MHGENYSSQGKVQAPEHLCRWNVRCTAGHSLNKLIQMLTIVGGNKPAQVPLTFDVAATEQLQEDTGSFVADFVEFQQRPHQGGKNGIQRSLFIPADKLIDGVGRDGINTSR